MLTTKYFDSLKTRPDRAFIKTKWIQSVIDQPDFELVQADGRVRLWGTISENENKYLRVILLEDRKTVHNAFFDRRHKP